MSESARHPRHVLQHELNEITRAMGLPHAEATDVELAELAWIAHALAKNFSPELPDDKETSAPITAQPVETGRQDAPRSLPKQEPKQREIEPEQREARLEAEVRYRRQSHVEDAQAFLPSLGSARKASGQRVGSALMLPAPPALANKAALGRSLRPLKKQVSSRTKFGIDEAATVNQIAEADTWFPILQPLPEKWLDAVLLIDRWNTMAVWHRAVAEFRQLLGDAGVFRQLTVYSLETRRVQGQNAYQAEIHTLLRGEKRTRRVEPGELVDADGRRLFLIITDGMAPIWQSGAASALFEPLMQGNYAALVNVLPAKLWKFSGLGHATRTQVWAGWHQTANRELRRSRLWYMDEQEPLDETPLPVMSLTPWAVNRWARMVAGETSEQMPAYLLPRDSSGTPAARDSWGEDSANPLSTEDRLAYFDRIASPLAVTLAAQLAAVAPLTMPLMRLVQQHHLPQSDATHQAEIFHAGLLRLREGQAEVSDPERVQYDFQPGLRAKLRRRVSGANLFRLIRLTARYIDYQRGGGLFQAALTGMVGPRQLQIDADSLPFAQMAVDVLRELGSRYEQFANLFAGAIGEYENPTPFISAEEQAARLRAFGEQIAQIDEFKSQIEPMALTEQNLTDRDEIIKWLGEEGQTWASLRDGTVQLATKLHVGLRQTAQILIGSPPGLLAPSADVEMPHIVQDDDRLAIDWCWVPSGPFSMGEGKSMHEVDVDGFWMMRHPVTNEQYRQFIEAGGYADERWWTTAGWAQRQEKGWREPRYWDDDKWNRAEQPVVGVSWYEAVAFCQWASSVTGREIRLPTEAEWEKAARGTDGREYPWGNERPNKELCNFDRNVGQTTPVGQYSPQGDSPYGCADMAGNVWDWCITLYRDYPYEANDGRNDLDGESSRVLRGGSWYYVNNSVRAAFRFRYDANYRGSSNGFRCASTPF